MSTGGEPDFGLKELWRVLWDSRKLVVVVPVIIAAVVAVWVVMLPNIYRGESLLAPVALEDGGQTLAGIEGLASLAGFSIPSGGNTDENLAVLRSRDFVWRFIQELNLMPILFENDWDATKEQWLEQDLEKRPGVWDAYRMFSRSMLNVSKDKQTGLVRVSIEWKDAELASSWTNEIVTMLNRHLRSRAIARSEKNLNYLNEELAGMQVAEMRQTLYQLIEKEQRTAMIVSTQEEYAFRVLDPSLVPDKKVRPKRALLVVMAGVLGFLFTAAFVIFRRDNQILDPGSP